MKDSSLGPHSSRDRIVLLDLTVIYSALDGIVLEDLTVLQLK